MNIFEANDESSILELLDHLNACHDGWVRRISFIKDRQYDEDGNLFYPCEQEGDEVKCDIEVELLLTSYIGALPRQIVLLSFKEVRVFRFFQESSFDYSEIYELAFHQASDGTFEFSFYESSNKNKILTLNCSSVIYKEYVEPVEGKER
jgi:hypothetical protein